MVRTRKKKKRATAKRGVSRRGAKSVRRLPNRRAKSTRSKRAQNSFTVMVADAGVFLLMITIGAAVLFAFVARDLPDTTDLWLDGGAPSIRLLANDGSPMALRGERQGAPIRLSELPDYVAMAFLAVEDRNFYHHFGVNPLAIGRAAVVNVRAGGVLQGGSTITQQLAKNLFLNADRTIKRKSQELILALWLEYKFSKQEILTLYLNRVYFGAGSYGINAASYRYFGKSAHALTLGEAAVLAGLLKAPSRFAPSDNPIDAGRRGRLVLDLMAQGGFITPYEASVAVREPIRLAEPKPAAAPYFIDHILAEIGRLIGEADLDLIVTTTFDPKIQRAGDRGVSAGRALTGKQLGDAQHAAVIMDGTGAIKAMIGGRDYRESQFNRATQARRQPGSAFKPVIYLSALNAGYNPGSAIDDAPIVIGDWAPANYNDRYFGVTSLSHALSHSLNSASVRLTEQVGREDIRRTARRLGWRDELTRGPAVSLGVDATSPTALAGIYAPFMNGGYRVHPHVIRRIETIDGDLLYEHKAVFDEQVISRSQAIALDGMLKNVVTTGTGRAAAIPGYQVAGKTGTTQNYRDAWFAGYADRLVCVVWVGNDNNSPTDEITGGGAPAIIWREIMARVVRAPNIALTVP